MALLTPQQITLAGVQVTYAAATVTTGDTFVADGRTMFRVNNASGGSVNATITVGPTGVGGATVGPIVRACPAGAITEIGPFDGNQFNDPTALTTKIVMSAVASVTVAAVRV